MMVFDPQTRLVQAHGREITLTAREFDLLWLLALVPVLVLSLASLLPAALALCRTCLPTAQLLMGVTCPPSRWVGVARPPHPHQACPLRPLQVPRLPWAVAWVLHPHHPRPPASTCPYCPHTQGRQARRPCPRLPRCTEWDRWASPARPPA